MIPEIWSMMDRTFCHFGPFLHFYPLNNPRNQNFEKMQKSPGDIILHMCIINISCMVPEIWRVIDVIIFHFGSFFALLLPPNSPKNQY